MLYKNRFYTDKSEAYIQSILLTCHTRCGDVTQPNHYLSEGLSLVGGRLKSYDVHIRFRLVLSKYISNTIGWILQTWNVLSILYCVNDHMYQWIFDY